MTQTVRNTLTTLAVAASVAIAAGGGVPRLIGTGCEDRPFGIALAREESDFMTQCASVAPLFGE